jgi:hypothetical protein
VLSQPESFSITLKGSMNPTVHHPSWYYTIGQLSKEDAAFIVENNNVHVTPALSRFSAPLFGIECNKKQWRIEARNKDARLRILHIAVKTFDDLLPETQLKRFGFKFTFFIEASHETTVDFLSKLMRDFAQVEGKGEIATSILSTTSTEPVRQRKIHLHSFPGANRALLTFSFVYPIPDERVFTLRQMSMAEDYELDYEEAVTRAEQIAYKLTSGGQREDINIRGN